MFIVKTHPNNSEVISGIIEKLFKGIPYQFYDTEKLKYEIKFDESMETSRFSNYEMSYSKIVQHETSDWEIFFGFTKEHVQPHFTVEEIGAQFILGPDGIARQVIY